MNFKLFENLFFLIKRRISEMLSYFYELEGIFLGCISFGGKVIVFMFFDFIMMSLCNEMWKSIFVEYLDRVLRVRLYRL